VSRQIEFGRRRAAKEERKRGLLRPVLLAAALWLGVLLPGGALASDTFEIQARVLGGASDGSWWSFRGVGVELPLAGGSSWTARGGGVKHKYYPVATIPEATYKENGSGSFLGIGFRFYRGAESKGWYFGFNLDHISVGVDWESSYDPPPQPSEQGHAEIVGNVPGISAGYKAVFDNGITFETDLYVGWLFAVDTGDLHRTNTLPGFLGFSLGKKF